LLCCPEWGMPLKFTSTIRHAIVNEKQVIHDGFFTRGAAREGTGTEVKARSTETRRRSSLAERSA